MATVYNDKIFGETVFQQLNALLIPLNAFTTDISDDLRSEGDTVIVPLYGNTTTTTFTQSTTVWEQTGGLISAVTVTLDKRKITPMDFTHQQLLESSAAGRFDRLTNQLARSSAKSVLLDIMSIITTVNFGEANTTTTSSVWARPMLIKARQALLDAGVPSDGSVVMNRGIESALLGDDKITLALNRGDSMAIKEGKLGSLLGLDLYSFSDFPANAISMNAFACGKDAIAVAFRKMSSSLPEGDFEAIEEFTDPETGLSMLYTRHWSRPQGKWFINTHVLYGYSKAVTGALKLFHTATT